MKIKRIILFSIILIATVFLSGCSGPTSTTGQSIFSTTKCEDVKVSYEEQEEYLKTEYYTETVPYTDTECENKPLVYKKEKGSCQQRQSGLLGFGDQPAEYSCTITNLDSEGGTFSMRIGFNVGSQQLDTTESRYIYPQSSETFSYRYDTKMNGCFCIENVPTKQVCRDVIKYKEVQKERQVTAYRPVTKYKTEQKCK
ncbi:MAG: hypothetical protein ABIG84_07695 [archaeon]